ncbi:hypothetical protein M011DRAFT_456064 [Sporormia fimetaria CBS 119925]|uniref:CUE domain-containing protein n=1 Tax=Sporormia fimetaria CBS 119925 TaxID=1340428 RepID=A0A6A6VLM6_9PLEO|nr:hypothetical protein M011DRAFT_456064 [Sporormia fimetaria CBS 119925]
MSENAAADKGPKNGRASGAESPTTARELDFDDDNEVPHNTEQTANPPPSSRSPKPGVRFTEGATEIPPPKPPRPVNKLQEDAKALGDMFPDIDAKVIKAVLVAGGGDVERATNALLSMSDPDFKEEDIAPPKPPRPTQNRGPSYDDDFLLAQRLQQEEQQSAGWGSTQHGHHGHRGEPRLPQQRRETGLKPNEMHDKEHSFFDDDLPVIRKNIEQGFRETQSKVNKWVGDFMKKLDGEPEQYDQYGNPVASSSTRQPGWGRSSPADQYGSRRSTENRRSADRERYDTDNRVLGDDFEALQLRDDEGMLFDLCDPRIRKLTDTPTSAPGPLRSNRPQANPNLFKPTPLSPPQTGPVDEVDALYRRDPSPNNNANTTGKPGSGKKWQPLTSIAPNPEPEDHDPFSLGDSDDEEARMKDLKAEDTQRLKKAAEGKEGGKAELQEAKRSGSVGQKDAAAEALLKESK